MENPGLKLTDAEQRYFGELFSAYDVDGQEKISGSKASELLLATQLPTETLQQITELCGAKRLGHFGRPQFYLAMKLIAAAQAGLPLKMDTFSSGVEVPLPRFHRPNDHAGHPTQLPPPPSKSHNKATRQPSLKELELSPQHQPYGPAAAGYPQVPPRESRDSSPEVHTGSDKTWTKFNQTGDGQLNWSHFEEHRQLLGNEEDSSDRHSSDEDHDVWSIADDQRDYYTNQFQLMQPDLRGKITGAIAKEFFEKSKLPVHELSKIWQLSDVDKDGALSIEEFCTAMHLVVLRRNNIELPETLPPCLIPKVPTTKGVDVVDATAYPMPPHPVTQPVRIASPKGHTPPPSKEPLSPQNKEWTKFSDSPTSTVSSPSMKPVNFDFSTASVEQDPRILHPVARRVSPDGHALPYNDQDKVALSADACGDCRSGAAPKNIVKRLSGPPVPTAPQQTLAYVVTTEVAGDNAANSFSGATGAVPAGSQGQLPPKKEPPPPPPPRPKRNHTRSSSLDLNRLGKANPQSLGAPPAVPPRISPGNEQEENEDDNNELAATKSFTRDIPRALDFANFEQFAESRSDVASAPVQQLQPSAFDVYQKPSAEYLMSSPYSSESEYSDFFDELDSSPAPTDDSAMLLVDDQTDDANEKKKRRKAPPAMAATELKTIPNEKYGLQQAVRAHRERNNMLMLLNTELNQELMEATEERLSLELQLENLKPFSC